MEIAPEVRAQVIEELRGLAETLAPQGRNAFPGICGTMSMNGAPEVPSGLYSEEATLKCTRGVFLRMLLAAEGIELYQPSNGTEGMYFMEQWCDRCVKDSCGADEETGQQCPIIGNTMAYDRDDPEYPREWRQDGEEGPRCTAFVERTEATAGLDPAAIATAQAKYDALPRDPVTGRPLI